MVVSLARVNVVLVVFVKFALRFIKKRERAAHHVNAEHIMVIGIVSALGLQSDAEVDVTCNIRNEIDQLCLVDVFDDFLEQIDDGEQIHIAVKLIVIACILDEFGTHEVEKRRNLNVCIDHELQRTVDIAALVRLRLDDEELIVCKAREEGLKHCAQIDLVVFATLELRRNVNGFAESESVNVVHIGVFCKFVAAEDVCARIGERNVEILDCKTEFERGVVLAAVADVRFVCNCACNVLVNGFAFEHRKFRRIVYFTAVAFAVVNDFQQVESIGALIAVDDIFVITIVSSLNFTAVVGLDCTHEVAARALFYVIARSRFRFSENVVLARSVLNLFGKGCFGAFGVVGIFVVSVAVKTERNVNGEVDAVGRVEFDLQAAVDFLIEQVFDIESEQFFGDILENGVKEFVAEFQREQVFVDEHRKSKFFVAEADVASVCVCGNGRLVGGRVLCSVACNEEFFVVKVNDVIFEDFGNIQTADCDLLNIERFLEIEVNGVVDVVRAEPQTLVTRFGDVDEFDLEFGLGEVVNVDHKRYVKSEVRGRISLRRRRHFDNDAREVAHDLAQNLAEIERAFGDTQFEFHGEAHRDDGVVEHVGRDIVIGFFVCFGEFVGVLDILAVDNSRMRFSVADICGEQVVARAYAEFDAAEFESHIDATDCNVKSEIEVAYRRVKIDRAIPIAVHVLNVTEQTRSQLFDISFFAVIADVGVACDIGIRDAFRAVCVFSVHSVTAQTDRTVDSCDFCVVVGVGVDIFSFNDFGYNRVSAVEIDAERLTFGKFAVRVSRLERALSRFYRSAFSVNGDLANVCDCRLVIFAACDVICVGFNDLTEVFCAVIFVSVLFVLVVGRKLFVQVLVIEIIGVLEVCKALVNGLTDIHAERNVEHVKHFLERTEVGHERCKHECNQRFGDLDLELSVAVRKQNYCVASCAAEILLVACSLSTVILFVAAFRAELVNNFLCKVNEVFDL